MIGDDEDEIIEATRRMSNNYDFVVTSGGIGPTYVRLVSYIANLLFQARRHYIPVNCKGIWTEIEIARDRFRQDEAVIETTQVPAGLFLGRTLSSFNSKASNGRAPVRRGSSGQRPDIIRKR